MIKLNENDNYYDEGGVTHKGVTLKKNEFVQGEEETLHQLKELGLSPGVSFFLQGIKLQKIKGLSGSISPLNGNANTVDGYPNKGG